MHYFQHCLLSKVILNSTQQGPDYSNWIGNTRGYRLNGFVPVCCESQRTAGKTLPVWHLSSSLSTSLQIKSFNDNHSHRLCYVALPGT